MQYEALRAALSVNTICSQIRTSSDFSLDGAQLEWYKTIGPFAPEIRKLLLVAPAARYARQTTQILAYIVAHCPQLRSLTVHIRTYRYRAGDSLEKHLKYVHTVVDAVEKILHGDKSKKRGKILFFGCHFAKNAESDGKKYNVPRPEGIHEVDRALYPAGPTERLCAWSLQTLSENPADVDAGFSLRVSR